MKRLKESRLFSAVLLAALGIALGLIPRAASPAGIPPLSAISTAGASDILTGQLRREVLAAWGEPDGGLSGFFGDIYTLGNGGHVIVYYDAAPLNEGSADIYTIPVQYTVYSET